MGEYISTAAGFFAFGLGGVIVGGLLVWAKVGRLVERPQAEPALSGYDPDGPGEETVHVRSSDPDVVEVAAELESEPAEVPKDFGTGYWPVAQTQRLDLLDGETVRIRVPGARIEGVPVTEAPWAYLTRNRQPEDWSKLTRTQEMGRVSG